MLRLLQEFLAFGLIIATCIVFARGETAWVEGVLSGRFIMVVLGSFFVCRFLSVIFHRRQSEFDPESNLLAAAIVTPAIIWILADRGFFYFWDCYGLYLGSIAESIYLFLARSREERFNSQ